MPDQVRVVDGDAPETRVSEPPRRGWVLFLLGFLVGVGAAIVFVTPSVPAGPSLTTIPEAIVTPSDPAVEEAETPGIGELVAGFPDGLVAVLEEEGRGLTYLLWPLARAPVTRSLPGGSFGVVRFDSSGRWIASTTDVPDREGTLLSMGITSSFRPLVSGVTSFAWHDADPGTLAFTQVAEGTTSVWATRPDRRPFPVIDGLPDLVTVQSWGEWGFALQDPGSTQILLYNGSGEQRATLSGVAHGSHPSGWIAAFDDDLMLVSAGGGVSRLQVDLAPPGAILNVELSPDRSKVAVRGEDGLLLADADTGQALEFHPLRGQNGDLAWSSDSRFVIMPDSRGSLVVDTETESMETILGNQTVSAVSVISLTGS